MKYINADDIDEEKLSYEEKLQLSFHRDVFNMCIDYRNRDLDDITTSRNLAAAMCTAINCITLSQPKRRALIRKTIREAETVLRIGLRAVRNKEKN